MGLLTSSAIVTSSFILGILFTSLLWDGTVLFPKEQVTAATIEAVEAYYLTWWNGAMTVKVFLHVVVIVLFLTVIAKFARRSETSYYFSGGSLLLLVLNASLYIVITIPTIRTIAKDPINHLLARPVGDDLYSRMQTYFAKGENARMHAENLLSTHKMSWDERLELVSVLCASNVIAMVFLAGVILLQVSEWYLDDTIIKEAEADARREREAAIAVAAAQPVTEEKKKQ